MGKEDRRPAERKFGSEEGGLRIHQAIARQLGTAIVAGVHKPGDLFEGEIEAAERLRGRTRVPALWRLSSMPLATRMRTASR